MIYNKCILKQGDDMKMKIIKRDGSIVDYNPEKIRIAIKKANNEVSKKEKERKERLSIFESKVTILFSM